LAVPEANSTVAESDGQIADSPQPNLSSEPAVDAVTPPPPPEVVPPKQTTSTGNTGDETVRSESDNPVASTTSPADIPDATFEETTSEATGNKPAPTDSLRQESVGIASEAVDQADVVTAPVDATGEPPVTDTAVSSVPVNARPLDSIVLETVRSSKTLAETSVAPVPQIDLPEPAQAAAVTESPTEREVEVTTDTPTGNSVEAAIVPVITDEPSDDDVVPTHDVTRDKVPAESLSEDTVTTGDVTDQPPLRDNASEAAPPVPTPAVEDDQFAAIENPEVITIESPDTEPVVSANTRLISDQRLPVFHVTADADGNAYLSQRDAILLVQPDGESRIWARVRAPQGHIILPDGSHVVCLAGQRAVVRLNADGEMVEEIANRSEGSFLRSPSHVVADSHGGLYFTDPGYARIRNPIGALHYITPEGEVVAIARDLAFPEGLALSSDGTRLLVAESQLNRVIEFPVLAPGKLGTSRVLARLPKRNSDAPDGFAHSLALDKLGRVYVAHGGTQHVEVIDRDGNVSKRHHVPNVVTLGVAFVPGAPQRLFVAGLDLQSRRGQLLEVTLD